MQPKPGNERLLGTTRGRVVTLLRIGERTVNELADELGLTDNAVRTHLAALERDGLVAMTGVRRAIGKPAHVYALTPAADSLFPRAYAVVLRTLLDSVRRTLPREQVDALVAEVAHRLAGDFRKATGGADARARAAVEVLTELGGVVHARVDGARVTIRGFGCPLRDAVDESADVCHIAAALLSEVVGYEVTECCDREGTPHCRFTFSAAA